VGDALLPLVLATKPLVYVWVFALARLSLPRERRRPALACLWGGLLRALFAVGLLLPFGAVAHVLVHQGPAVALLVVSGVRFLVWRFVTLSVLEDLGEARAQALSGVGTLLDLALDLSLLRAGADVVPAGI
jgi:hypothetical protein